MKQILALLMIFSVNTAFAANGANGAVEEIPVVVVDNTCAEEGYRDDAFSRFLCQQLEPAMKTVFSSVAEAIRATAGTTMCVIGTGITNGLEYITVSESQNEKCSHLEDYL